LKVVEVNRVVGTLGVPFGWLIIAQPVDFPLVAAQPYQTPSNKSKPHSPPEINSLSLSLKEKQLLKTSPSFYSPVISPLTLLPITAHFTNMLIINLPAGMFPEGGYNVDAYSMVEDREGNRIDFASTWVVINIREK
jgi:hypothetical protein